MKQIKARGLVLREYEAGESDKRLLIFCKEHGRLMVYARGARKPVSKFMAAAQLFTYADYVLVKGAGFYSLAQAQVIESFYPLREDYDRLMSAHLVAEACEKTLWDNIESDELLKLALKTLSVLAKGAPPVQTAAAFLLRFFDVHGLRPQADTCVLCNAPAMGGNMVLCAEGLVCDVHKPAVCRPMSPSAIAAVQHVLNSDLANAFRFTATDAVVEQLQAAVKMLWKCHFEWELKTL